MPQMTFGSACAISDKIDVLVFTVEGREYSFRKTMRKLDQFGDRKQFRRIVAADGNVAPEVLRVADPDLILSSGQRRGYIGSILDALPLIQSEFFIWMEDDWDLRNVHSEDVRLLVDAMQSNPSLMQIKWSRFAPLVGLSTLSERILISSDGFSANPNISRTSHVRDAFGFLLASARRANRLGVDGFENVLTAWGQSKGLKFGVLDPGSQPSVDTDLLESTGREWHMTGTLKTLPVGHGYLGESVPIWRRCQMLSKLFWSFGRLTILQLVRPEYYELAFRIVHLPLLRSGTTKAKAKR